MSRYLKLVIFVGAVVLLAGNYVLIPDIMESRNLVTAREMVLDGNWLVPTMNGELRLEKPPLPTWIAAVTMILGGQDWWLLRLVPALVGILMLVWLFKLAYRTTGNSLFAMCSSLILCTCYNFALMAKTVTWDIYSNAFMLGGIYYMYCLLAEKKGGMRNAILSGGCIGLSLMSKGPVSLYALFLPFLVSALVVYRDRLRWNRKYLVLVLLVAVVIGATWYIYIWMEQQSAGASTLAKESGSWLNRSVRPWWYYSTFFTETGIWAVLCVTSLFFPYWKKRACSRKDYVFSLVWMIGILVFLSLLPEKKNRYLLPVLIPSSLAMGYVMEYWIVRIRAMSSKDRRIFNLNAVPVLLVELVMAGVCVYMGIATSVSSSLCWLLAGILLVAVVVQTWGIGKRKAQCMLASIVICFMGISAFGMPAFAHYLGNPHYSSPRTLLDAGYKDCAAYYPQGDEFRIELVYDMGRKVLPKKKEDMPHGTSPYLLVVAGNSRMSPQDSVLQKAEKIGVYDANRQAFRSRPQFQYTVYLVSPEVCR